MWNNPGRLIRTLSYLKWKQVFYRLWYRFFSIDTTIKENKRPQPATGLKFIREVSGFANCISPQSFIFLNHEHTFVHRIDWNFSDFGKLWTYNLNYFQFLFDEKIDYETRKGFIDQYIHDWASVKDGKESYPVSIRTINWIRFLAYYNIQDAHILNHLYGQLCILRKRFEYHILGNHLLENAFALLLGSAFFKNEKWRIQAECTLRLQLDEQILRDGMHYERSTMYHHIVLFRIMEAVDLFYSNHIDDTNKFQDFLREKASLMIGWLEVISNSGNEMPLLNDSSNGITYTASELFVYAASLGIKSAQITLSDSGYRKLKSQNFDLLINVGSVTPSYQPGHAHADTFSIELYHLDKPIIIDPGISTYNIGERRSIERSTLSHNTVSVYGEDSSEVWGGFRVGRRALVEIIKENSTDIVAKHNGYRHLGICHTRFLSMSESCILIEDDLTGNPVTNSFFSLHFHPSSKVIMADNSLTVNDCLCFELQGFNNIVLEKYLYTPSYNIFLPSLKFIGIFFKHAQVKIKEY